MAGEKGYPIEDFDVELNDRVHDFVESSELNCLNEFRAFVEAAIEYYKLSANDEKRVEILAVHALRDSILNKLEGIRGLLQRDENDHIVEKAKEIHLAAMRRIVRDLTEKYHTQYLDMLVADLTP